MRYEHAVEACVSVPAQVHGSWVQEEVIENKNAQFPLDQGLDIIETH